MTFGIQVIGRSCPNDKLLLVKALKKRGHVVSVTGDGTNEAPALKEVRSSLPFPLDKHFYSSKEGGSMMKLFVFSIHDFAFSKFHVLEIFMRNSHMICIIAY